jgi:hypothetical protein
LGANANVNVVLKCACVLHAWVGTGGGNIHLELREEEEREGGSNGGNIRKFFGITGSEIPCRQPLGPLRAAVIVARWFLARLMSDPEYGAEKRLRNVGSLTYYTALS